MYIYSTIHMYVCTCRYKLFRLYEYINLINIQTEAKYIRYKGQDDV